MDKYLRWYRKQDGRQHGKINSAFAIGEEDATIETVQNYLNLPIDYYVNINFTSFEKIIDAIGGVTVDVPYDINEKYTSDNSGKTLIPKGRQSLNGEQALILLESVKWILTWTVAIGSKKSLKQPLVKH